MKVSAAEQLVDYLEDRGIEHIFGLCGHTNIAVLAALERSRIKFVKARHEQMAAHMADGYARVKGQPSVLLVHLGPGLTNAATGVANAAMDSVPMVVIAGDVPSYYHGKHPHQEVNLQADAGQYEIYRPFVKRAWRVDCPELFPETVAKAFQTAASGRSGPVLVSVPMDVFSTKIETSLFQRVKEHSRALEKSTLSEDTAGRILQRLLAAEKPLIYAGGGILLAKAWKELRQLVEHLGIPVAYTLMGKGALPDDHPLCLGMTGFWGTRFVNDRCREADCILALGTRFSEADCSSWDPGYTFRIPPTKLIQIDIDSGEIGRNYPVEIGVVCDLKTALDVINRVAGGLEPRENRQIKEEIAAYKKEFADNNMSNATSGIYPMRPERILADLREVLPKDAYITTDVGWNKNGVGQQFPVYEPGTILTPGGYATMGFGAAAAVGAKLAAPDRTVVSLIGDGGFGQNPSVLATAVEEGASVVFIIMNNHSFGTIAGLERSHYGTSYGTVFEKDGRPYSPDYGKMAATYGAEGVTVSSAAQFRPALERALGSGRPFVIDVAMLNEPVPTAGYWNINDIYTPPRVRTE